MLNTLSSRNLSLLMVLSLAAVLAGCGGGMTTHPVSGKVTMPDGSPAKMGSVVFEQTGTTKPISCIGPIKSDGTYKVEVDENTSGAPPGDYKVTVLINDEAGKPLIDPKYATPDSTPLAYTVKSGTNTFDIKLE
jgi:hypothetical protein